MQVLSSALESILMKDGDSYGDRHAHSWRLGVAIG